MTGAVSFIFPITFGITTGTTGTGEEELRNIGVLYCAITVPLMIFAGRKSLGTELINLGGSTPIGPLTFEKKKEVNESQWII